MKRAYITGLYSIAHFFVDFACAFFIFGSLRTTDYLPFCLLAYNFFAFAMQLPFGIFADILKKNHGIAAFGCLILSLTPLFSAYFLLPFILAGLGNGLFHIGAGREVLQLSRGKLSLLGIFVSPGALGLYFGGLLGRAGSFPAALLAVLLAALGLFLLFIPGMTRKKIEASVQEKMEQEGERPFSARAFPLALLPLFLVIFLRSYVGLSLSFPWKGVGQAALWLSLALVGGKAAGGILADRLGVLKTSFISLSLSAVLLFFFRLPALGILSVFLFNMTMPLSLGGIARLLPGSPGFAFGLTTFALFLGFLPVFAGLQNPLALPNGYIAVSILSAILLYYGFRGFRHAA